MLRWLLFRAQNHRLRTLILCRCQGYWRPGHWWWLWLILLMLLIIIFKSPCVCLTLDWMLLRQHGDRRRMTLLNLLYSHNFLSGTLHLLLLLLLLLQNHLTLKDKTVMVCRHLAIWDLLVHLLLWLNNGGLLLVLEALIWANLDGDTSSILMRCSGGYLRLT